MQLLKYPRTHHIEGSRFQPGDEELDCVPFAEIAGRYLVVEEKMDGANTAISFDESGNLLLQSRGHYLTGGEREKHFTLFKQWAHTNRELLWKLLSDRFIAYGEWLYAKHTIFYNRLPHYWLEFDVFDREEEVFLSTKRRTELFRNSPIVSVRVLHSGYLQKQSELARLHGLSCFIGEDHMAQLRNLSESQNLSADRAIKETDPSNEMEGLYIKVEEDEIVKQRYKFIRTSFLTSVLASDSHWLNRPIIPNQLIPGTSLFHLGEP